LNDGAGKNVTPEQWPQRFSDKVDESRFKIKVIAAGYSPE
jgi:hypothetical protein